ncbi:hypothetical protein KJ937_04540 [Patescibacteria group bacterium]|nr:hypothetical protein [Patescibacteria group bacterium]
MTNTFEDFLKYANSQKEISLVIAKDDDELESFTKKLSEAEFRQAVDTSDLFKHITKASKTFVAVKDALSKDLYDFAVQYPTGQIEIYDKFNLKSQTVVPVYKDVSVTYVLTKDAINKTQESGFRILEIAGITYQS